MAKVLKQLSLLIDRAEASAAAIGAPEKRPASTPKRPRAPAKPVPEGGWYAELGHRAVPLPGQAGYRADPVPAARALGAQWFSSLRTLWEDPSTYGSVGAVLERAGAPLEGYLEGYDEEDPQAWSREELADVAGVPASLFEELQWTVGQSEQAGGEVPEGVVSEVLTDAALSTIDGGKKPRLVLVPPEEARAFVAKHHSKLPKANAPGLLYSYGVMVGARLVAVALVNHPTGGFRSRPDRAVESIVELTRIASDGSQRGASSMLAARAIDLLPVSGRRGEPGLLFVTYSLTTESGMTYLALVDKGLRPVHRVPGQKPSGARKGSGSAARPEERKIAWHAGPAAAPPDWSLLEGLVTPELIASSRARFENWEARTAKARR